jgi:hypothetical protein
LGLEFGGQLFDFELEGRVLGLLALEEAGGELGLGGDPFRSEQVGVANLSRSDRRARPGLAKFL